MPAVLSQLPPAPGNAGPKAGSHVGHDVATPAGAAASRPPRLNLARDIAKAGKADCRKAYADAGLLAVVQLLAHTVKGSGCKW